MSYQRAMSFFSRRLTVEMSCPLTSYRYTFTKWRRWIYAKIGYELWVNSIDLVCDYSIFGGYNHQNFLLF